MLRTKNKVNINKLTKVTFKINITYINPNKVNITLMLVTFLKEILTQTLYNQ